MVKTNNEILGEIVSLHPSICYSCEHARKPASDENTKKGYVGYCLRAMGERTGQSYDLEQIESAKEIAEGWVDLKSRVKIGNGSGIITNFQLLTLEVIACKKYKQIL